MRVGDEKQTRGSNCGVVSSTSLPFHEAMTDRPTDQPTDQQKDGHEGITLPTSYK